MKKLLLVVVLLLAGCLAKYKDVSSLPEYQSLIGARYSLAEGMVISGVNAPPGYGKEIDFYLINPEKPGWAGRELISREPLEAGSIITLKSIRECTNCFGGSVSVTVALEPSVVRVDVPIYVDIEYIKSREYAEPIE